MKIKEIFVKCSNHPKNFIVFHCLKDNKYFCLDCYKDHNDHSENNIKIITIEENLKDFRDI